MLYNILTLRMRCVCNVSRTFTRLLILIIKIKYSKFKGYLLGLSVLISKTINHILKFNMKNAFKFGFLALIISVSMVACKGSGSTSATDSDSTTTSIDTTVKVDSTVAYTTIAVDTTKKM